MMRLSWCQISYKAQKTNRVKQLLEECSTTPVCVPAGCTGIVQPLDVSFNALIKKSAAHQHMQDNLDGYLNGNINAGERRVLLTWWVGEAWEELATNEEMVIRSFKKCGISVAVDGSEYFEIHLEGVEDYQVNQEDEFSSDSEDPLSANSSDVESDTSDNDDQEQYHLKSSTINFKVI